MTSYTSRDEGCRSPNHIYPKRNKHLHHQKQQISPELHLAGDLQHHLQRFLEATKFGSY